MLMKKKNIWIGVVLIVLSSIVTVIFILSVKEPVRKYNVPVPVKIEEDVIQSLNTPGFDAVSEEEMEEDPYAYINGVKGHEEEECISINLKGTEKVELSIEQVDSVNFKVICSNPEIPVLELKYTICPRLVNEGDLDGNGSSEIGILDTWMCSSCRLYRIYTLRDNKWFYLVPPLETSTNIRASGVELAEPTGKKGEVRVRYADFEALLSCCTHAPIKDTIMAVGFLPIE